MRRGKGKGPGMMVQFWSLHMQGIITLYRVHQHEYRVQLGNMILPYPVQSMHRLCTDNAFISAFQPCRIWRHALPHAKCGMAENLKHPSVRRKGVSNVLYYVLCTHYFVGLEMIIILVIFWKLLLCTPIFGTADKQVLPPMFSFFLFPFSIFPLRFFWNIQPLIHAG